MSALASPGLMLGVDHIGVGCSDMGRSIGFYADLGFTDLAFEYEGPLPGMEAIAGRGGVEAHLVVLRSVHETPLGNAAIKLVHTLDAPPPPMPEGMAWGEPGVCEVCIHATGQAALYRRMVEELGYTGLMEPNEAPLPPHGTRCGRSYVADPDGTKVEMIEWLDLERGWPWSSGPQGVNHVAFGVADIERTRDFYAELCFDGMLFESDGHFEPMHPWYAPRQAPRRRAMLLTNPHGAGIEPVQHLPASPDMRGQWGHLGPFEFGVGVGVRSIELAAKDLAERGIQLRCAPQSIELGNGASWRYAYFVDPDEHYVCLSELRC